MCGASQTAIRERHRCRAGNGKIGPRHAEPNVKTELIGNAQAERWTADRARYCEDAPYEQRESGPTREMTV
jgi:hypothetical protein